MLGDHLREAIRLRRLRARSEEFEETFWSGGSLEDLYDRIGEDPPDPMAAVFAAAMREWRHAAGRAAPGSETCGPG